MMEHIDEFIPPALRGYIPKILGGRFLTVTVLLFSCLSTLRAQHEVVTRGEMSDWESRARSNPPPMQYVIREPPHGEKL
ncbi:hypothetical protein Y032_0059g2984 [Ancylostoma ceylanicum]|nr:hypothetical protein Y032_0059g2984 [Ancylostoma ceylanicum]